MKNKLVRPILVECNDVATIGSIFKYTKKSLLHDDEYDPKIGDLLLNKNPLVLGTNECFTHYQIILISLDSEDKVEIGDEYLFNVGYASWIKIADKEDIDGLHLEIFPKKVVARQSQLSSEYISKFIEQYNSGCVEDFEIEIEDNNPNNQELMFHKEHNEYFFEDFVDDKIITKYLKLQPKLTNGLVTIVEKVYMCLNCKTCKTNTDRCDVCGCGTFEETHPNNNPTIIENDSEIIGKPLERYINEKHNQDRCIGFIDGYNSRKSEEVTMYSEEEVKELCKDIYVDSSHNLYLSFEDWFNDNKKK